MPALSHLLPAIVTLLLIGSIYLFSPNYRLGNERLASPLAGDYLHEWIGGWIISQGDISRLYDLPYALELQHDPELVGFEFEQSRYLPMVYPPYYYVLVSPLSRLPFVTAVWIWNGLMIAAFFAAAGLLLRQFPEQKSAVWLLPAACLFAPLIESFNSGQKGTVLLLIFAGTYLLLKHQRPFASGLLFGLLAVKPQLAIVIGLALLCKRDWWFVAGSAVTVTVCAVSAIILGVDVCQQYVEFSRHVADYIQTGGYTLHKSHSWYGFFALLAGTSSGVFVRGSTLVAGLMTVVLLAKSLRGKLDYASPQFALQFAGLTCGSMLISPHLYTYDLTILLLPMTLLLLPRVRQHLETSAVGNANFATGCVVTLFVAAGIAPAVAATTHIAIMPLLMFAGVAWIAYSGCRLPSRATSSPSPPATEIAAALPPSLTSLPFGGHT